MNIPTYKGYTAKIKYSEADGCLIGRIDGIRDIIAFEGDSVAEIHKAFEEAVDDYYDMCAEMGKEPPAPFSGEITLRIPPEDHVKLAHQAHIGGKSINALLVDVLRQSGTLS